mgnify:CR=1 FL=1
MYRNDEVLRIPDGRGRRPNISTSSKGKQEWLRVQAFVFAKAQNEASKQHTTCVIGEDRAGRGHEEREATKEVFSASASPREDAAQVLKHVGFFEVYAHNHGSEEKAEDGQVYGLVGFVGS